MPRIDGRFIRGDRAGSPGDGPESAKKLCSLKKRFTLPRAADQPSTIFSEKWMWEKHSGMWES